MGQLKNKPAYAKATAETPTYSKENIEKHEFAFFLENLSTITRPNTETKITDKDLMHRLLNIVRLAVGESFIIFNQKSHAICELISIEKKKSITIKIIETNINKNLEPKINLLVPILKRENFESVVYSCVELGANNIVTLTTEKSQKTFNQDRSLKILIAAAEQSKNFAYANLNEPIELTKYINSNKINKQEDSINIFFDAEGENLDEVVKNIKIRLQKNIDLSINLMIGPEGDLTESEKIMLRNNGFIFCKLTPTILRSFQAVNVGLGVFRALLV